MNHSVMEVMYMTSTTMPYFKSLLKAFSFSKIIIQTVAFFFFRRKPMKNDPE